VTAPANGNMTAFLGMVKHSEGTDKAPDPYAVTFGYQFTITDFSDHPAVLGTWKGYPLDFLGPLYAGETSTAAGAYQIIKPTWLTCKKRLNLPDFSPASQDAAAVLLITNVGAARLVDGGQVAEAILKCASIWASLPGSTSDQPQAKMAELIQAYTGCGGGFA
jgi:muramidase (phage lysozyme)